MSMRSVIGTAAPSPSVWSNPPKRKRSRAPNLVALSEDAPPGRVKSLRLSAAALKESCVRFTPAAVASARVVVSTISGAIQQISLLGLLDRDELINHALAMVLDGLVGPPSVAGSG